MEPQNVAVADLAKAEPGSVAGTVRLDGWLFIRSELERGWIGASEEDPTPVVFLSQSKEIYEELKNHLSMLGGSSYAYVNYSSITGSLDFVDGEYVLSDVEDFDVYELRLLSLRPIKPLKKK